MFMRIKLSIPKDLLSHRFNKHVARCAAFSVKLIRPLTMASIDLRLKIILLFENHPGTSRISLFKLSSDWEKASIATAYKFDRKKY